MTFTPRLVSIVALLALVNGCTVTRVSDDVPLPVPEKWANAPEAKSPEVIDIRKWWTGFDDPTLERLIAEGLAANRDLAIARARVREALASATVARSLLFPTVEANGTVSRSKDFTRVTPIVDNRFATLAASWELDLFGGNRLEAEAADAQARGADEARRAVQVSIAAEIARSYFELRSLQARIELVRRNIDVQRETLRLVEGRFRAGLATDFDLARATTQLKTTEATLPELIAALAAQFHRLGVLLGKPPTAFEATLRTPGALPRTLPSIPPLLPSELLAQRPDLRRAREAVTAGAASLGAARADLLPKFFLSASGGWQSVQLGSLPSRAGNIFALGAALTAPIFNAGRIRANIEAVDARLAQVAAAYEKAFLESLEDVESAYVIHATAKTRRDELAAASQAAERARKRAEALFERGATDYLTVLDAQRTALASEDGLVRSETAVVFSIVGLYRAFGGGWDSSESQTMPAPSRTSRWPGHELDSSGLSSGGRVVQIDDVDIHYERARAAGARIDSEAQNQATGRSGYGARDPEGHRRWLATPYKE
jgi:NodT family efflux transporter outer membrane factor (OMF) lipoprotein